MEEAEIRAFVRILRRLMAKEHLTMQGMARRLGVSTSHLSMVLSGQRRPGIRLMWAAMQRYPEVHDLVRLPRSGVRGETETPPGSAPGGMGND